MNKKLEPLIVLIGAILFTFLFHKETLGLNLLLFETTLLIYLFASKQLTLKNKNEIIAGGGLFITALFTVITYSAFSITTNFIALFVFVGVLIYPEAKSMLTSLKLAFQNIFKAQFVFFKKISNANIKGKRIAHQIWKTRLFIVPILIVAFFIFIYRLSNPVFDDIIVSISTFIYEQYLFIIENIDWFLIFTFFLGLLLSNFTLIKTSNYLITAQDSIASDVLIRKKKRNHFFTNVLALKNEYKAAIFLFLVLNVVLLLLNATDVYWVWFNFSWDGQYLKEFVHEGTILLIISILISIALVLYFFRANINFYRKNKFLKFLCYAWITQNAVLALSVTIRNFYYINYFALAYKRIGVILFILLVIYGLYTVYQKVKHKRSAFYLFRSNAIAMYLLLVCSSLVNWDTLIAKYNFRHAETSFTHLNYLSSLSDKTLPYTDKSLTELDQIVQQQKNEYPNERSYISAKTYHERIERRKEQFKTKWESKSILSWNLPEHRAYRRLFHEPENISSIE